MTRLYTPLSAIVVEDALRLAIIELERSQSHDLKDTLGKLKNYRAAEDYIKCAESMISSIRAPQIANLIDHDENTGLNENLHADQTGILTSFRNYKDTLAMLNNYARRVKSELVNLINLDNQINVVRKELDELIHVSYNLNGTEYSLTKQELEIPVRYNLGAIVVQQGLAHMERLVLTNPQEVQKTADYLESALPLLFSPESIEEYHQCLCILSTEADDFYNLVENLSNNGGSRQ